MKYKQYFATQLFRTDSVPTLFAIVESNELVVAVLPEEYKSVSAKQYRKLKWLERKFKVMERKERFKERAVKLKKAMKD